MKTITNAVAALFIFFAIQSCTKDVALAPADNTLNSSVFQAPEAIFGSWNLTKETDSTFYNTYAKDASWSIDNWIYNFKKQGTLDIVYEDFSDSFSYNFISDNCMRIGWLGSPAEAATDTILTLTDHELIFKHWDINTDDNSKTKKIFYLTK